MQYARDTQTMDQLTLFQNAWMASRARMAPLSTAPSAPTPRSRGAARRLTRETTPATAHAIEQGYSEIALNGSPRQCLQWLAPVLRELSQAETIGWLTLVNPPVDINLPWLRSAGLDPERVRVIHSAKGKDTLALCCDVLRLGNSHTVVSWLAGDARESDMLTRAARAGNCSSLNVRLQASSSA